MYKFRLRFHLKFVQINTVLLMHIDGLVQDCSNSIANALELLQSCTKPSIYASLGLNES